jgi:wyosine [tRNA(Phe)-imidazoG37] synthetase (radical SAM superfamily)
MDEQPDIASEFMRILDEETRELMGEEKARELRKNINKRLKEKEFKPVTWEEKEMKREKIIKELKEMHAKKVDRKVIEEQDPELLEIIDCKEYMRFVFFDNEVRYLPDGNEPHPLKLDEWEKLTDKDIANLYDY